MKTYQKMSRRRFLNHMWPLGLILTAPAYAIDLFKILDPKGESKDLNRIKKYLDGAESVLVSTRDVDYQSEFAIGESLALEGFKRYGLPVAPDAVNRYVNLLGNAVARNSTRPRIPYYFVVVNSSLYNAFACPGGIIFISSALFTLLDNEAELATVLAHEVGHVTHKHALSSIKRAKFFEGVTKITTANMKGEDGKKYQMMISDLQNVLFDKGLDKKMEFEADLTGMEFAYRTGYRPDGFISVLNKLQQQERGAEKKGSWFSTHPPLDERIGKCREKMNAYPDAASLAVLPERFNRYKKMIGA